MAVWQTTLLSVWLNALCLSPLIGPSTVAIQSDAGMVPGPFDCYLAFRGMRTLHVRMPHHMRGAVHVAKFLEGHPHVESVLYPGLESHPQVSTYLLLRQYASVLLDKK